MSLQRQIVFWGLGVAALLLVVYLLGSTITPFAAGIVLGYLLDPVVLKLQRFGFNRLGASLLILTIFVVTVVLFFILVVPVLGNQFIALAQHLPGYAVRVQAFAVEEGNAFIAKYGGRWLDALGLSQQLSSAQIQKSVGDFVSCYEPLLSAGRDVVSIHIAGGLSGTCESAREAARILAELAHPGRVEVLDSQTGAGGLGCLVLLAAELAAQGATLETVIDGVRRGRESLDIWFCLDTLEYLRRGGRIGAAQALVGTALKVKPILTFASEIAPVGRVRTHGRALERMRAYLLELRERGASDWIVQHAQAAPDA